MFFERVLLFLGCLSQYLCHDLGCLVPVIIKGWQFSAVHMDT